MNMKSITLTVKSFSASVSYGNNIELEIELQNQELERPEIIEEISIDAFVESCGEASLREYCEKNFDWFDKED